MNIELQDVYKTFGNVHANDGISLIVREGEVQGILGENGAGKSTLMKILSGYYSIDSGSLLIDSENTKINCAADAVKLGIGMLHQDPLDFPPMKVIDSLIIGSKTGLFPNKSEIVHNFKTLCEEYGFSLSPEVYIDSLTVGERQQLELIRLLWLGAKLLILDEPTTGISASQKESLFRTVKLLSKQGKSVIFVTHKLDEIDGLCSQVAVFRQGKNVGQMKPPYNTDKLIEMMFGKSIIRGDKQCDCCRDVCLSVTDLSIDDLRTPINKFNIDILKGEVIGLAGMEGSGQTLLLRAMAGIIRPNRGKILLNQEHDKNIDLVGKHYFYYRNSGIAFLPASRMEEGLIPGLTLTEHFTLAFEQSGFFWDKKKSLEITEEKIRDFNIKGTPTHTVESLSGGNQQRAELALMRSPLSLMLLEHPSRGLDIESTMYIWNKFKQRCVEGTSIVFISSDLDEVIHYSDRILVFFAGKISQPFNASQVTVDQLGQLIGGKGW